MLDVLIVGCGNIAGGFDANRPAHESPLTHAGAYRAHGGFRLAACVEPNEQRRKAFMERWEIPYGFATIAEAISAYGRFDVVSICSPTSFHHSDTIASLGASPSLVFCEKPLASNLADAQDMEARCRSAGALLAVNHNRRWAPDVVRLQTELTSGAWGKLRSATGIYNKGVLNNGSHMIDLLLFLLGPMTLSWIGSPVWDHRNDDPSIPATLSTSDNVSVLLGCGYALDYSIFELQLIVERGTISMENGGLQWRLRRAIPSEQFAGYTVLGEGEVRSGEYMRSTAHAVANIYESLSNGAPLASTGESALNAQRLCEEIRTRAVSRVTPTF